MTGDNSYQERIQHNAAFYCITHKSHTLNQSMNTTVDKVISALTVSVRTLETEDRRSAALFKY